LLQTACALAAGEAALFFGGSIWRAVGSLIFQMARLTI